MFCSVDIFFWDFQELNTFFINNIFNIYKKRLHNFNLVVLTIIAENGHQINQVEKDTNVVGNYEKTEPAVVEGDVVHRQADKEGVPGVVETHGHVLLCEEWPEKTVVKETEDGHDRHYRFSFRIVARLFFHPMNESTEEVMDLEKVVHGKDHVKGVQKSADELGCLIAKWSAQQKTTHLCLRTCIDDGRFPADVWHTFIRVLLAQKRNLKSCFEFVWVCCWVSSCF